MLLPLTTPQLQVNDTRYAVMCPTYQEQRLKIDLGILKIRQVK